LEAFGFGKRDKGETRVSGKGSDHKPVKMDIRLNDEIWECKKRKEDQNANLEE